MEVRVLLLPLAASAKEKDWRGRKGDANDKESGKGLLLLLLLLLVCEKGAIDRPPRPPPDAAKGCILAPTNDDDRSEPGWKRRGRDGRVKRLLLLLLALLHTALM